MDSAGRRIPQSEWNLWKDIILDLISDKTLEELMVFMKDEKKFIASRSQYQKQLNIWKDRKNLTSDEWADIFEIQDKLDNRQIESRIFISGRPVPASKIQRARRYCKDKSRSSKSRTMNGHSAFSRNVSMEILGADGKWTPYANLDNDINETDKLHNEACGIVSSPNSQAVDGTLLDVTVVDGGEMSNPQMNGDIDHFGRETTTSYQDFSHISGTQDLDIGIFDVEPFPQYPSNTLPFSSPMAMIQFPSQQESLDFSVVDYGLTNYSANSSTQISFTRLFDFQIQTYEILCDLPFKRFENNLKAQGIHLTTQSPNAPGFHLASMVGNPVKLFLEDIQSSISELGESQNGQRHLDPMSLLLSLKSLLSHEDPLDGCDTRQRLITNDEILQTKFNKLLVFSIVNGFAGLQNVPIQSVLKYLSRHGNISSLLLQFLQANQSHAANALAENLFRAAIEGKDEHALKRLLAICSVDVNNTICVQNNRKYTPIERAASLRDLGIVELLLSAKADVNKTCALESTYGGALAELINGLRQDQTITPEIVELAKLLLKAGAKVHYYFLRRTIRSHELTYCLFSGVPDSDHSYIIRDGILDDVSENLDDCHATEVIKKIFLACEQTKCGKCLQRFEEKVDWALVQGTKRGHLQLVRLLLSHSKTPHRALSAAIRSGRNDLIDTIFILKPDINAPAHSIDSTSNSNGQEFYKTMTTSLAEAINAKNERLVQMIENSGYLEHLGEGRRFEPVITAASKTGDTAYVQKLLDHFPSHKPSQMTAALSYAVQNDHEEIFFALLAAGASVNFNYILGPYLQPPLFAAMLRRKHNMVRKILNADVYFSTGMGGTQDILREAIKWGDESIIQELLLAFPEIFLVGDELSEVLKMNNMVWFEFILRSGIVITHALTQCLETALSKGDGSLVHYLVKCGADPTNDSIFKKCAEKYPKMLPLLLGEMRPRIGPHVMCGFGTNALGSAIKNGPAGFEAVKVLLDFGHVDLENIQPVFDEEIFNSMSHMSHMSQMPRSMKSPLGLAIKQTRNGDHADFAVIRRLLDYGCNPNRIAAISTSDDFRIAQTVLLEAIETKSKDLVELLISRGSLVRPKTMIGLKRTPLQKAVEVDSFELVTLIIEAGADVNEKPVTNGGATAFQLAAIGGNCSIALKLLEHGADMEALPARVNGRWPLEGAAEYGRLDMIEFLWKLSTVEFNQKHCQRAVELAEENGHMACKNLIGELSRANVASTPVLTQ